MTTTVIIPHEENKDKTILLLLDFLIESGPVKIERIKNKMDEFCNGRDIFFDIATDKLPMILRRISDDGFVYKPEGLKGLQSDHLTSIHNYNEVRHEDFTVYITAYLNETINSDHVVTVTDNSLTADEKTILISAIKSVLKTLPKKVTNWDIDIKKVSPSISLTPQILHYSGQKWTQNYFKV